jgi:hypothetical protein
LPAVLGFFGHGSFRGLVKQVTVDKEDGSKEHSFVFNGKGVWEAIGEEECRYVGDWENGKRHGNGLMTK